MTRIRGPLFLALLLGLLVPDLAAGRAPAPGASEDPSVPADLLLLEHAGQQRAEWRNLRGPGSDGSVSWRGALSSAELAWKRQIGPGYSGVSVADGRAVTAFSDEERDVIVAWSTTDGQELWRTPFAPTYRGHDGSTDGPIGTPTLTDERVYLMGPHGDLLALSVETGEILWRKSLETTWGARRPFYGFGSSPLEVDGVLVVPGGAGERVAVGLDPENGDLLWSLGDGGATYTTPVRSDDGLLVLGSRDLVAVDPGTGRLSWSFRHSERPSADPTYPQLQLVADGFLLLLRDEAVRYDRAPEGPRELWRSTALKGSVATPVVSGDHAYGFSGTFLTCVDLENGEAVWKSRAPRSRGLILVGEHLVMVGSGGVLSISHADPGGFREAVSLAVSDHAGYTAPSFADGRIYFRNRSEIVSVEVGSEPVLYEEVSDVSPPLTGDFAAWLRRIETSEDPAAEVQSFLDVYESFPILEPDRVHFAWTGEADHVSLLGQMNDDEIGERMMRVGESSLFVLSHPTVPGGRWQYRFQVDFADPVVDPRNPHRGSGGYSDTSEVFFAGFEDPDFATSTVLGPGGRLENLTVSSAAYGFDVEITVYLPAGYDEKNEYPLVVLPNGAQWLEAGGIVRILDHLFASELEPAVVSLVPMQAWVGGSWGERAVQFLGRELLPEIDRVYSIAAETDRRSLWTVEDKAAVGLQLASMSPQPFGRFAFQSPKLLFQGAFGLESVPSATRFRVSWSRYEPLSLETGVDDRTAARELHENLDRAGFEPRGGEFVAGPGYRTWRREAGEILDFLLAPTQKAAPPR